MRRPGSACSRLRSTAQRAGVARHAGTADARSRCGRPALLLFVEPTAQHPDSLLRPDGECSLPGKGCSAIFRPSEMLPLCGVCAPSDGLGGGLRQVHLAAEDGIVFDREAQRADIALEVAPGPQLHAAAGHHVALHMAHESAHLWRSGRRQYWRWDRWSAGFQPG